MGEESQSESKLVQLQQSLNTFLYDDKNPFAQMFAMVEKYSQNRVKRTHAFWGKRSLQFDDVVDNCLYISALCGFVGLYLLFGYGAALLANLVGFVYPAYKS